MKNISRRDFIKAGVLGLSAIAGKDLLFDETVFAEDLSKNLGSQKKRRVFITGSTTGLGFLSAKLLIAQGHQVVVHARNERKAKILKKRLPKAHSIVVGDLAYISQVKNLAHQVNKLGQFDSVIHNAAIFRRQRTRGNTVDGLPTIFAVNALAPYILTALIHKPERLIYMSSGLHHGANFNLDDVKWNKRRWSTYTAYGESKFYDALLAVAIARYWPQVFSNAVTPGWVPTRMGGSNAPDDLQQGYLTQSWLAVSDDKKAKVSGKYFFHMRQKSPDQRIYDTRLQDKFIQICQNISGIKLPNE